MIPAIAIALVFACLFVGGILRPWHALVLLLALLPFNGLLVDVLAVHLGLTGVARTVFGGWHDALALGFVGAAAVAWLHARQWRPTALEWALVAVLASGLISVVVAAHTVTALYAFRNLYEPITLAVAVVALARSSGLPGWVTARAPVAVVASGVAASLYSILQVYVGGYAYLVRYFSLSDGQLPTAYLASYITQPRAIGTFHSPNELGAYLAIAIAVLATPGLLAGRRTVRAWALAALSLGLFLTFSRSAWIGTIIALALIALLPSERRSRLAAGLSRMRSGSWLPSYGPPAVLIIVLAGWIAVSSGAIVWATATIMGDDPSSASRVEAIQRELGDLFPGSQASPSPSPMPTGPDRARPGISLFGVGLGMVGPLSSRFEEIAAGEFVSTEMWYANYLFQAGIVGSIALFALVLIVIRQLAAARRRPWARLALSIGAGLGAGAVVIPIIDAPAVATPLWVVFGLALALRPAAEDRTPR